MPYLHLQQEPTMGYFGCGPGGRCTQCRRREEHLSIGEPATPTPSLRPSFTLECPAGCAPATAAQCSRILYQAIREAIRLATNAASKLDAVLSNTASPADVQKTVHEFRVAFGRNHPSKLFAGTSRPTGGVVAARFRALARELGGGRRITFRCLPVRPACADTDLTCCSPTTNAWTHPSLPNVVVLCPGFWSTTGSPGQPSQIYRAGTIIHETLHMLYLPNVPGTHPGRMRNAHCYRVFALRLAGYGSDPDILSQCQP